MSICAISRGGLRFCSSKAKDNNASCSVGPFVRFFDETFSLDDVRKTNVTLTVEGEDGFKLEGSSVDH